MDRNRRPDQQLQDLIRRDLTINAIYADPDGAVTDPVGGLRDLAARMLRGIGAAHGEVACVDEATHHEGPLLVVRVGDEDEAHRAPIMPLVHLHSGP